MPDGGGVDPVTLGEVVRNLEKLGERVESGFARIDQRFDALAMVHQDVYLADRRADAEARKATNERIETVEKAVDGVKDSIQWVWRTVAGAVIVAVVTAIVVAAGIPH